MRWLLLGLIVFVVACAQLPGDCSSVHDPYDRDYCVLTTALEQNLSSACSQVTNEHWQTWCYTDVASNLQDPSICKKISLQSSQEHCVKNIAIATQNVDLCEPGSAAGDECFRTLGIDLQDANLCEQVVAVEQRNKCYVEIAELVDDYTLCKFVDDDIRRRDSCLFRVTLRMNATQGCGDIFVPETRDICFVNHAIKLVNSSICDKVGEAAMGSSCRAAVKLANERANTTE